MDSHRPTCLCYGSHLLSHGVMFLSRLRRDKVLMIHRRHGNVQQSPEKKSVNTVARSCPMKESLFCSSIKSRSKTKQLRISRCLMDSNITEVAMETPSHGGRSVVGRIGPRQPQAGAPPSRVPRLKWREEQRSRTRPTPEKLRRRRHAASQSSEGRGFDESAEKHRPS